MPHITRTVTAASSAEGALQKAMNEERSGLAYAYVNNGGLDDDPVGVAKADVNTAQAEVHRLEKVEAALAAEVERVHSVLRQLRANLYAAMSEFVCSSDEYQALIEAHTAAWWKLRTVKQALQVVTAGLHAQMPQRLAEEAFRAEPLEIRVGYPVDADFVSAWADAMAALEQNADARLPNVV